jgi:serine phosphatase RsbU (regulator of sigma subunit)
VVGDVQGKGPDAAAVTALARHTLRAAAAYEERPSGALAFLHRALVTQDGDRFLTVAYARVRPRADTVEVDLACGGYPLPLVVHPDGTVDAVGRLGTLLGTDIDPLLADVTVELELGDVLVLYTDGVTEAKAPDVLLEPSDVARVVQGCPPGDAADIARCIEEAVLDEERPTPQDDIAILVIRALDEGRTSRARSSRSVEAG